MRYIIEVECDNAAFYNPEGDHDPCAEVANILENLCLRHLRVGNGQQTALYDTNGNRVGCALFVPDVQLPNEPMVDLKIVGPDGEPLDE